MANKSVHLSGKSGGNILRLILSAPQTATANFTEFQTFIFETACCFLNEGILLSLLTETTPLLSKHTGPHAGTEMNERIYSVTGDVTVTSVITVDVHQDRDLHKDPEAAGGNKQLLTWINCQ